MRRLIALCLAAAAFLALTSLPSGGRRSADASAAAGIGNASSHADRDKQPASADEVIVRFEPGTDANTRSHARGSVNAQLKRQLPVEGMQLLEPAAGTSPVGAVGRLEHQPGVAYAEPNFSRHALGSVN